MIAKNTQCIAKRTLLRRRVAMCMKKSAKGALVRIVYESSGALVHNAYQSALRVDLARTVIDHLKLSIGGGGVGGEEIIPPLHSAVKWPNRQIGAQT